MSSDAIRIKTPRGCFTARSAGECDQPLVVCLHGFLDDASTFDDLLGWLGAHGFHAVAPYLRGHSPSPRLFESPDRELWRELTEDVHAICAALSPRNPVSLVSHGAGSLVGYSAISQSPDRFLRAVTLGPERIDLSWLRRRSLNRNGVANVISVWQRWSPGWKLPAERISEVTRTLAVSWPGPLKFLTAQRYMPRWMPIHTPICQIVAEPNSPKHGIDLGFTGPHRVVGVSGAGFFLHLEQPQIVSRIIVEWLTAAFARTTLPQPMDVDHTEGDVTPEAADPAHEGRIASRSRTGSA